MALLEHSKVGQIPNMPLTRNKSGHYYYTNYLDQNHGFGLFHSHNNNNNNNNNNYVMLEKRQVFLRSYQFSRKKSFSERIKRSWVRVKRVICHRLKSARRFRRLTCFRLRCGFSHRRRRFVRLLNNKSHNNYYDSNCFW